MKLVWNVFLSIGLSFGAVGITPLVYAKPNLQPLGANIAETGSAYYQFQIKEFQSEDGQRKYRVWLGIPQNLVSSSRGLPSLFMLDGNSVMSRLNEPLLKSLAERDAPVLVAIGYQTNLPFESTSRSLDYTPADASGLPKKDPRNSERMSGGSTQFRQLITSEIIPWVESQIKLDHQRQALWGHSYGGLFVLDSLMSGRQFSHYFAASPSLSWADQRIVQKLANTPIEQIKGQKLVVMEGDLSLNKEIQLSPNMDLDMIQNNRKLVQQVVDKEGEATLVLYPHLSHGEVFQRSLMDVLNKHLF